MATRRNNDICLFCFGTLNGDRVCVSCGKKEDDSPTPAHHLKRRTVLQKRYVIDKAIGEGGFGITYRAWDTQTAKKVAIKEYYPSGYVTRDPRSDKVIINSKQNHAPTNRGLKRFIDEAQNLSKITDHSGIVEVLNFFSANSTAYIVMEFLDGISLKSYVKRKGKLTAPDAFTILKPVILSLRGLHATGLIHRDISPDNVLITREGEVKLIDFGAAKHSNGDRDDASIVLKQGFAPEEQYRATGEQGPWTDIYALGVTLYYCMTGIIMPESIQRIYEDTVLPPSKLGVEIHPKAEQALMKALAVFAKDRYKMMDTLIDDLYGENDYYSFSSVRKDAAMSARQGTSEREKKMERSPTVSARDIKIQRKRTAQTIKDRIGISTPSRVVEKKESEPNYALSQDERYKKVTRKYDKAFPKQLADKLKRK
ncbi:MAG: serine/threonine protein kinase [Clostridia bacterium]|nr:serine/threonine protein kinase [Clostridia bacterium]